MIMTLEPGNPNAFAMVDVSKAVAVQEGGGTGNKFSNASGTTHDEAEMPETLPFDLPIPGCRRR